MAAGNVDNAMVRDHFVGSKSVSVDSKVMNSVTPNVANKGIATRDGLAKQTELARGNSP